MVRKDLYDASLALPPAERLELAWKLLASVGEPPSAEWSDTWVAECDSRVAATEDETEQPASWGEVYGRLRARSNQQ